MSRRIAVAVAMGSLGCQPEPVETVPVVIALPSTTVSASSIVLSPPGLAAEPLLQEGRLSFALPRSRSLALRVGLAGYCPTVIPAAAGSDGTPIAERLVPLIELGAARPSLGFDASFEVTAQLGCDEARRGTIEWQQIEGLPLREWQVSREGHRLNARASGANQLGPNLPWGVVPVSPREQGRAVIEARWRGPDGREARDTLSVAAIPRSRGLSNVPVGSTLLLGGKGWHSSSGAQLDLQPLNDAATLFSATQAGDWLLTDEDGRTLRLKSSRYDQVPLDCTRGNCHAEIPPFAGQSGMSSIYTRSVTAANTATSGGCALSCHTLGEPGLEDGGFVHVAEELAHPLTPLPEYAELPAALQRLANVGCLSCHGPGALPNPEGRHNVLRAGVCAYCHDAPPRYGHVAAWRASRMALADRTIGTNADGCRRCHTTQGFLATQLPHQGEQPQHHFDEPIGVSCVACHAVHGESQQAALVREVALPSLFQGLASVLGRDALCVACHAPDAPTSDKLPLPSATAAAIWAGRGGYSEHAEPLSQPGPHRELACTACHRAGSPSLERGAGHQFRADPQVCTACHASEPNADEILRQRALRRLERLGGIDLPTANAPVHARPALLSATKPRDLARYNLLLVIEDRAAFTHNPRYARLLLEQAERMLHPANSPREAP